MKFILYKHGTNDGSRCETASLGMGIVARSIKDAGHRVIVLDGELTPGYEIHDEGYDILAMSVVSLEARDIEPIRKEIKAKGKAVWIGGPHAIGYHDLLEGYDKIIVGDADGCIEQIINSPDVTVTPRVEHLLAPDYSDFIGIEKMIAYSTYISRGCMNNCSFCNANAKIRGVFRKRDLSQLKDEFDTIARYPAVKQINLIDDSFSADLAHAKAFIDWYLRAGYPYKLNIFNVRADQIDDELLDLMVRAGVEKLPVGVESGCPEVFDFIGKGEKLTDIENAIRQIKASGITPWLNMIVGLPKDSLENNRKSIAWSQQFGDCIVHWFQFTPYRGTRAYRWLVEHGAIADGYIASFCYGDKYNELPWRPDFGTADFTIEEREAAQLEAWLSHDRIYVLDKIEHVQYLCDKYQLNHLLKNWYVRRNAVAYLFRKVDLSEELVHVVVSPEEL